MEKSGLKKNTENNGKSALPPLGCGGLHDGDWYLPAVYEQ